MSILVLKHVYSVTIAILLIMNAFVDPTVDTITNDATMQNPLHMISVGNGPRNRICLVELRALLFFFRTCPGFSISFSLDFLVKICWLNWRYTELEGGVVLSWCCVGRGCQGGCGATWLMLSIVSPSAPRSPQWQALCHCTSWLFDVIWPCSGTTVLVFRNLVFSSQAPLPMDF